VAYLNAAIYPQYQAHRFIMAKPDVPDVAYQSGVPANLKIHFEKTPVAVSAVVYGPMLGPGPARSVATKLTLYAGMPVADLEVLCDKPLDAWPEAGWICLPLNLAGAKFRLGRLGGDVDPLKDITVATSTIGKYGSIPEWQSTSRRATAWGFARWTRRC